MYMLRFFLSTSIVLLDTFHSCWLLLGLKVRFDYRKKECKFVNLASVMLFDIDSLDMLGFHTTCSALVYEHNALVDGDCKLVALLKTLRAIPIKKKNVPLITYLEL